MKSISIIIRTKNEERWIGHCLEMIYKQTLQDFEVVLVDNKSDDHTVEIAKRYPVDHFVNIDEFLPGRALNEGIRTSHGNYIVCLSAHCVPKDEFWLENLRKNFNGGGNLAGVYGRQLPVSFTDAVDKRDLLIVFGQDYRIQKKDYFFHNANSMLPRSIWKKFPFDEQVTNIEDRVWGKQVIEAGYTLAYDPEAAVFHHHGLHQGNNEKRANGVVSILEKVDKEVVSHLPDSMLPINRNVSAVILIENKPHDVKKLKLALNEIYKTKYINRIFLVSSSVIHEPDSRCQFIDRNFLNITKDSSLEEVLRETLICIEKSGDYPDALIYINPFKYEKFSSDMLDELVFDSSHKGLDTVFFADQTYEHIWYMDEQGNFSQVDESLERKEYRKPLFKALYGLGCITSSIYLRKGRLIGDRVGIIKV